MLHRPGLRHPDLARNSARSGASQSCGDSEVLSRPDRTFVFLPHFEPLVHTSRPLQRYPVPLNLKTGNPRASSFPKSPPRSAGLPRARTPGPAGGRQVLRLSLWSCRSELRLGWNVPRLVRSEVRRPWKVLAAPASSGLETLTFYLPVSLLDSVYALFLQSTKARV